MMQKYNYNDMLGGNVLVQPGQGLTNKPTCALLLISTTYDPRTQAIININPYRPFKVSTLCIQYLELLSANMQDCIFVMVPLAPYMGRSSVHASRPK